MADRVIAGKLAVVTGGARGIGLATAEALLREGVRVVVVDLDLQRAQDAIEPLKAIGPEVAAWVLDVRDANAYVRVIDEIESALGPVDILVNNAGIMPVGGFLDQSLAMDERQISVNVFGVIHGMRTVLPGMLARGRGHVVNIASAAGKVGIPGISTYCATKHAVVGLTEAVRNEFQDSGVSFSYVMPAIVNTELTAGASSMRYPPPAEPGDVAAAVVGCLRTGQVDVFVPRFARIAAVLPVLLPRRVSEAMGRWFGLADAFLEVDEGARDAYRSRIRGA